MSTRHKVAKLAGVQQRRIDEICAGKRSITGDTALRFARLFGTDAAFWINLQAQYDLETTLSGQAQANRGGSYAAGNGSVSIRLGIPRALPKGVHWRDGVILSALNKDAGNLCGLY